MGIYTVCAGCGTDDGGWNGLCYACQREANAEAAAYRLEALTAVIEQAIDALPMERRLYPDTYALTVAEAVTAHLAEEEA